MDATGVFIGISTGIFSLATVAMIILPDKDALATVANTVMACFGWYVLLVVRAV